MSDNNSGGYQSPRDEGKINEFFRNLKKFARLKKRRDYTKKLNSFCKKRRKLFLRRRDQKRKAISQTNY